MTVSAIIISQVRINSNISKGSFCAEANPGSRSRAGFRPAEIRSGSIAQPPSLLVKYSHFNKRKQVEMTELLYLSDSYTKTFKASVIGIDAENKGIVLDRTAFYPGGGGQPADLGTLTFEDTVVPVVKTQKINGQLLHLYQDDFNLPEIGSQVEGRIDWEHRYQLMRTHTAMHILCGVIFRDYGASVTGGNMDPLKGRMDFEFETMQKELVDEINLAINQEVKNARFVHTRILPREQAFQIPDLIRTKINLLPEGIKEVRIVEIEGLDIQADGGTHVANTSEVGRIRVVDYKSKGKINKRIYVELD
jgi:misacylated tRNA(Ala) deacylase